MANDSADFAVRLHDELTGPARAMRAELKGLQDDLKRFSASSIRAPRQTRERKATDGIREPKMLSVNDRIRIQEREEKTAQRARDKAEREAARNQKATDRAAAQERRNQERNVKAQERDAARLRKLMASDQKAKLASVAKQDKAYRAAAVAQQRQMDRMRASEVRAEKAQVRERERQEKKARQLESRRLADMAHDKVLRGGVGAEVKGLMGGSGGGLGSSIGLGSLLAGGAIAAGIGVIVSGLAAIKDAAMAAARAIGNIALSFASASIDALRFQQNSEMALGNLLHGGENARKEFDDVRNMAQRLGLDVQDTVHSFQKLLAAQFEVGRAKELLKMGSDLQGIGASADEVGRALLAITQIKSKGRLMASEMLQLQEAGISSELVYKALGARLGKTRDELAKLQEAGKIDAGLGIDAILEAVRKKTGTKEAGELGEKVARGTIDGMVRVLRAGVENAFTEIGRALEPIVMPIAQKVIGLFDVIRNHPGLKILGELIINRLVRVRDWALENWPTIEAVLVKGLDAAAKAGVGLLSVGDYIVNHWEDIKNVLKTVGIMAGVAAINVGILGLAFAGALAPILAFWKVLSKIVGAFDRIAEVHAGLLLKIPGMKSLAESLAGPKSSPLAPEKKAAEPGSLQAMIQSLKTGVPASNDNSDPWWAKDSKTGASRMVGGRTSLIAGGDANAWDGPVRVQPQKVATQSGSSVAPMRDAAAAQNAAAAESRSAASETAVAANALLQAAERLSSAAGQMPKGGGGGESDLAGMLEAV